jgi:hypothetical protein
MSKASFLIVFLLFSSLAGVGGCRNIPVINSRMDDLERAREDRLSEIISQDDDLRNLANGCEQAGAVLNFKLIRRSATSNVDSRSLHYYYQSDAKLQHSFKAISQFLEAREWHPMENLSMNYTLAYQKSDQRVIVQHGGMGDADYGITCQKIKQSE